MLAKKQVKKKQSPSNQGSGSRVPLLPGTGDLETGVVEVYKPPVRQRSYVERFDKVVLEAILNQVPIFIPGLADLLSRGNESDLCLSGAAACSGDMASLCDGGNKDDPVCTAFRVSAERTHNAYYTFGVGFIFLAIVVQIRSLVRAIRVTFNNTSHLQVINQASDVMGRFRSRINEYISNEGGQAPQLLLPGVKSSDIMSAMASQISQRATSSQNQLKNIKLWIPAAALALATLYAGDGFDLKKNNDGLYVLAFYLFVVGFCAAYIKNQTVLQNITPSELVFEQLLESCGDYIIENLNTLYCPDNDMLKHSATLDDVNKALADQQAALNQCKRAAGKQKVQSSADGRDSDSDDDVSHEGAIDRAQAAAVAADDDTRRIWSLMTGLHGSDSGNDGAVGIKDLISVISQEGDEVKKIDWFDKLTSSVLKSIMHRYSIPFEKEDKTAGSLLFYFTHYTDTLSTGISAERKAGIDLCVDVSKHIVQSIFCESCPDVSLRSYIWDIIGPEKCQAITDNPKLRDPRSTSNVVSSGNCGIPLGISRVVVAATGVIIGADTYSPVRMFGVRAPGQHSSKVLATRRSSAAPGQ